MLEIRHLIKPFIIFIVSILILNVSCVQQHTQWQGTIEEVDGVTVVNNPQEPLYGEIELELERDLSIGRNDKNNYLFFRVRDIALDGQQSIYVLDAGNFRIQKFDSHGRYLQTIGQKGQGPGEFQNPLSLFIDSQDTLFVLDGREIDIFKKQGMFDRSIILETSIIDFFITTKSDIWARVNPATEKKNEIIRLDSEGKTIDSVVRFSEVEYALRKGSKKGSYVTFVTFHDYTPQLCFVYLDEQDFSYGFPLKYEIFITDNMGFSRIIIRKEETQKIISRKEKNKIIEELKNSISESGRIWPDSVLEEACNFPAYRPHFSNIDVDEKKRLFVMKVNSTLEEKNFTEFDLFNSHGFYLYRVIIPGYRVIKPQSPRIIRNGFLFDIQEDDETGAVFVRRFRIQNWNQIKDQI